MNEPMEQNWGSPLTQEDRDYFAYFRTVCKRYNIVPSKATRLELEYEFVTRVAESEFHLQKAATQTHLYPLLQAILIHQQANTPASSCSCDEAGVFFPYAENGDIRTARCPEQSLPEWRRSSRRSP